ncbi:choice-of-anchor D domain-containing protein [Leptospira sarikeiensis]|uniref:Choice-of-anchor D domain-containing protein n=1 Tax=Leptospira sarikeiensis TaxID=2484943 RepID=A0A4R9KC40_9LEPT|nr:choice-of-anchor D domain-containing protein [Leptospira sarikeiensis]TGL64327.1 choice-of-anchor D domain-containing protein [Leptospira sarikeiensis]
MTVIVFFFAFGNCTKDTSIPLLFGASSSNGSYKGIQGIYLIDQEGKKYPSGSTYSFGNSYEYTSSPVQNFTIACDCPDSEFVNLTGNPIIDVAGLHLDQFMFPGILPSYGETISENNPSNVEISFLPSSLGVKTAKLIIPTNDPNIGSYILNLVGTGKNFAAPRFQVTEEGENTYIGGRINFVTSPGQSITRTFVVSNTGEKELTVNLEDPYSDHIGFTWSETNLTIAPGKKKKFTTTYNYSPTGFLYYGITLRFTTNDPNSPIFDHFYGAFSVATPAPAVDISYGNENGMIDVRGSGAVVQVGNAEPGKTSSALVFTMKNTGNANLDFSQGTFSLSGDNQNEFVVIPPTQAILAPGEKTTFSVRLKPNSVGFKIALLTFEYATRYADDPYPYPFNITLLGGGGKKDVYVTWPISRNKEVNTYKGGHTVCYKKGSSFSAETDPGTKCEDVLNWESFAYAPTFTKLYKLSKGTWYVRIKSFVNRSPYGLWKSEFSPVQTVVIP